MNRSMTSFTRRASSSSVGRTGSQSVTSVLPIATANGNCGCWSAFGQSASGIRRSESPFLSGPRTAGRISDSHLRHVVPRSEVRKGRPHSGCEVNVHTFIARGDRDEELVLVGDVEPLKAPESVGPSLVRLELVQNVERTLADAFYLGLDGVPIRVVALADREAGVVGDAPVVRLDEMADQVIERRAEVVKRVAHDCSPAERDIPKTSDSAIDVARLRVIVGNDFWCAFFPKSHNARFEITDVLVGPFGFHSDQLLATRSPAHAANTDGNAP